MSPKASSNIKALRILTVAILEKKQICKNVALIEDFIFRQPPLLPKVLDYGARGIGVK